MKKILFSLKTDFNKRSDAVGLPLLMILYADFYSHLFNHKIDVFDPFFEIEKNIKNYNFNVIKNLDMNFTDYEKISNPLFHVSNIKINNSKNQLEIEGKYNLNTKIYLRKNKLQLNQRIGLHTLGYLNKFDAAKNFDIPYQYYLEWLFRDKFLSNIELKKKISLPLKNKYTFAIQFDYYLKKDTKFAFDLISKIKKENVNSNIIIYGQEKKEFNKKVLKLLNNEKCIFLEDYSKNPLVKGILLGSNANYYISKSNGFTDFAMAIGKSKKKLKKSFCVYDQKDSDSITSNVRRNLREGLLENKISKNSFFFHKTTDYYEKKSILKKKEIFTKIKSTTLNDKKSFFIGYSSLEYKTKFFSKFFDEIINNEMLDDFNKSLKKSDLILFKNKKFYNFNTKKNIPINKINFKYAVHILSHYRLINENDNDKLLDKSLDFNKPNILKMLSKKNLVNPGNLIYEDLFSYFIRKSSKKNFCSVSHNRKIKKILVLDNPFLKRKNSNKYINFISKHFQKKQISSFYYDWKQISKQVKDTFNCELNFLYLKDNLLYKSKNNRTIKTKMSKEKLTNIINEYENIICLPTELSLIVKFLSKKKNNLIFLTKTHSLEGYKNIINEDKKLFATDYSFNYFDIFDVKFNDLTELFLYLFKRYKKIN